MFYPQFPQICPQGKPENNSKYNAFPTLSTGDVVLVLKKNSTCKNLNKLGYAQIYPHYPQPKNPQNTCSLIL